MQDSAPALVHRLSLFCPSGDARLVLQVTGVRTDGKLAAFSFTKTAMRQTKPKARREHTPVWQIIRSLRPRHKQLLQEIDRRRDTAYWVKEVSKDLALVPLKLLHILLAGYQPQHQRPSVRYHK